MDWYEHEVRHLESIVRSRPPSPEGVCFYGSSSVRLWSTLKTDFPGETVVNLGFGGSTLAACAHFFRRLVPPTRPRSIVLYAGDNDLGDGRSPADVLAAFDSLLSQLRTALPRTRLAVLAIKPSPARWHLQERIRQTNQLLAGRAAGRSELRFVDIHTPMLSAEGRPRSDLYATDGLHLSPNGYRVWADVVARIEWIFAPASSDIHADTAGSGHNSNGS